MDASDLAAIEEIRQLKARYFRCIDSQDWIGLTKVFTEDACLHVPDDAPDSEPVRGRDRIAAMLERNLAGVTSVHQGHQSEISVDGDTATGRWAMEDRLWWSDGPLAALHGWGHYDERYRRDATGRWRIDEVVLRRTRVDLTERDNQGDQP